MTTILTECAWGFLKHKSFSKTDNIHQYHTATYSFSVLAGFRRKGETRQTLALSCGAFSLKFSGPMGMRLHISNAATLDFWGLYHPVFLY